MPNITYAVVSTAPQPASQVSAEQSLLTNLVNFSHNAGSQLPAGYAPLPTGMYNAAITAITNDLVAQPSSTSPGGGSAGGGTGSGSSASSASGGGGSPGSTGTPSGSGSSTSNGSTSGLPNSSSGSGGNGAGTPGSTTAIGSQTAPLGTIQLVLDDAARFLLPGLAALALACLLIGPLLYVWPSLRRRRRPGSG
jgi:hypothetical protein